MANDNTKSELMSEVTRLTNDVSKLRRSLGTIRKDVMTIKFPHEHRETMDRVLGIIDREINRS